MSGSLARFLLEEVFPEVERHEAPDGRPIRLSQDPNDRAVGGASTGGIGSFTLAWERPDAFRRVFTAIGTFVGMRGGDRYPVLVRKTEPKPIRVFMQDGSHDGLPGVIDEVGDWWMSNQTLERALKFAGYSVEHVWGEGSHDLNHPTSIFPQAMRWLWKDWPQPVTAGETENTVLHQILLPGEGWRMASDEEAPARALRRDSSSQSAKDSAGRVYEADTAAGTLWLRDREGQHILLDSDLAAPTAIALSPDGLWLAVGERATHWGYSYRVQPDGTVQHKQRFYWFHVPDEADDSGVRAWVPDREGRLYAATRLGVQVFDRNGRVRAILPLPGGAATDLTFGGDDLGTLYVLCEDGKAYGRPLKVPGFPPGAAPIELSPSFAG